MKISLQHLIWLSSAGYGVMFSLALSGAARIAAGLAGYPLTPEDAGLVFLAGCVVLVPITTYFRFAKVFFPPATTEG